MKIHTRAAWLLGTGLALAGAAALSARSFGDDVAAPAVKGTVKYAGQAPDRKKLDITKDPSVCGKQALYDESLVVGAKGELANVVVFVDDAPAVTASPVNVTVDQKGCRYAPHVQAAIAGARVTIKNGDAVLHNAHGYGVDGSLFNLATPMKGSTASQLLDEAGPVSLKCDAGHTWMSAWIYVFEHPYFAVTGPDGSFELAGLPPGTYTLQAWHEKLGEKSTKVTVEAGKTARVQLELK